jgi:murein DD-endopeptidase MepM/ murein hydrolase activator NlpD
MNSPSPPPAPEKRGNRAHMWAKSLHVPRGFRIMLIGAAMCLLAVAAYLALQRGRQRSLVHNDAHAPVASPAPPPPEFKEVEGTFRRNQTITQALLQQGLSGTLIQQIVDCARPVYDLKIVKADHPYFLYFTQDGTFRDFRYPVDDTRYLTVYHDVAQDRMVPVMKNFKYEIRLKTVSAVIEDSLYASIVGIGEQYQLAMDLADIFGSDIDFNTDIQRGDSFRALVERRYLDGKFAGNGAVLAASVSNKQKVLSGFRFEDEKGKPAYYAPDGKALKRSFLKAPLKVFRITSRFSLARMHPILKVVRPHLGVDYAAPIGTPVQAVGAGVVVRAGRSDGSGKMVRIRHSGGYETSYMHLSRIAVKVGARVSQGEIIGNVGSTGLSTGPHLDFRIFKHGTAINPAKVIFPPGKPVPPDKFDRFAALRDKLNSELQMTNDELQHALNKDSHQHAGSNTAGF